ncbi:FAD-dependent oxidoreductase [Salinigranum sp.]|uniref:FAD-dependent oxidoreductase n=1 Tax=Salinigranum sp. TaxID=1966351 RepID=UPI0035657AAF
MDATVTVVSVHDVGSDTVAIEFETPAEFRAMPGQFVKLAGVVDGEEYARFYTLSSPDVEDTFEVTVGVSEEGGPFSHRLAALEPGDTLEMQGPFGSDHYEGESRVVVLAGGPGVGPAVGIGERALADGNDVAVVYLDDDPAHETRLEELAAVGATVLMDDADADLVVHLRDALRGHDDEQVFVYGFADFVDRARDALAELGHEGDPKVENFG